MDYIPPWHRIVVDFLTMHAPMVAASDVIEAIDRSTLLLSRDLPSGERLLLVRMASKMIEREEVFMGSLLYADWLRKGFKLAVEAHGLGRIEPVTNDLEAGYFLLLTHASLSDLAMALHSYVEAYVEDLFLADDDPARGIHGNLPALFSIPISKREPFPIFAFPRFMLRRLEQRVRLVLRELIAQDYMQKRYLQKGKIETKVSASFRHAQCALAFLYGRDGNDMQSPNLFMVRLATEYQVITLEELVAAYNISKEMPSANTSLKEMQGIYKRAIKAAIENLSFNEERLRLLLNKVLGYFGEAIDNAPADDDELATSRPTQHSWLMPYIRSSNKAITMTPQMYTETLLHRVSLGTSVLALAATGSGWVCRTCGDQQALVDEKNILLGISVGRFYNQRPNQPRADDIQRICVRCALYSYLGAKVSGVAMSGESGEFPVPKWGNLIFHYGQHTIEEVRTLGRQLDKALDLIKKARESRIEEVLAKLKEVDQRAYNDRRAMVDLDALLTQQATQDLEHGAIDLQHVAALMERLGEAEGETVHDILEHVAQCQVIDLGMGKYRLVAFVISKMKGEPKQVEKRFIQARLTIYALIGFLQQACACAGPYFFRTLPHLTDGPDCMAVDHFYVGDQVISGTDYRYRYKAAAGFAKRVTRNDKKDALKDWLGLSEDLAEEPLETFAKVLRNSPRRTSEQNDAYYRVPANREGKVVFNQDMHVFDGWEYLRAYQSLHELWEDAQRKGRVK